MKLQAKYTRFLIKPSSTFSDSYWSHYSKLSSRKASDFVHELDITLIFPNLRHKKRERNKALRPATLLSRLSSLQKHLANNRGRGKLRDALDWK